MSKLHSLAEECHLAFLLHVPAFEGKVGKVE